MLYLAPRFAVIATFVCGIVLSTFSCSGGSTPPLPPVVDDSFTIIALPDIQYYSQDYPQILTANMQWIVNNTAALNIKYVVGLGDTVNVPSATTQWRNADAAYRILDNAGVPYGISIGNHDYDDDENVGTRQSVNFNHWFGRDRYSAHAWFGDSTYPAGSTENFHTVFNINGVDYLFLHLEFFPRDAALQWARTVLEANQQKRVIVVTHGYENTDNYHLGKCDEGGPSEFNANNDGDMIWSKLVSQYPNILMVLSGHRLEAAREIGLGVSGNLVNELMTGWYNNDPNGGNGYLRIITITPSKNRIEARTFSPYANASKTDSNNQFSLSLQAPPMNIVAGQATIRGRVRRTTNCSAIVGATISYQSSTNSGSTITDSEGYYSVSVPSPATYTVTASADGHIPASSTVKVADGYGVPARFLLAPQ